MSTLSCQQRLSFGSEEIGDFPLAKYVEVLESDLSLNYAHFLQQDMTEGPPESQLQCLKEAADDYFCVFSELAHTQAMIKLLESGLPIGAGFAAQPDNAVVEEFELGQEEEEVANRFEEGMSRFHFPKKPTEWLQAAEAVSELVDAFREFHDHKTGLVDRLEKVKSTLTGSSNETSLYSSHLFSDEFHSTTTTTTTTTTGSTSTTAASTALLDGGITTQEAQQKTKDDKDQGKAEDDEEQEEKAEEEEEEEEEEEVFNDAFTAELHKMREWYQGMMTLTEKMGGYRLLENTASQVRLLLLGPQERQVDISFGGEQLEQIAKVHVAPSTANIDQLIAQLLVTCSSSAQLPAFLLLLRDSLLYDNPDSIPEFESDQSTDDHDN